MQPLMASSQVPRTLEDHGMFQITPNMGTLPPHQSVDFILEFAPKEVSFLNLLLDFQGFVLGEKRGRGGGGGGSGWHFVPSGRS